jgi:hypothetical protein
MKSIDQRSLGPWGTESGTWATEGSFRRRLRRREMPLFLALKAEALFTANRSSEALEAVEEAQAVSQKYEAPSWSAELHRFRAVFLVISALMRRKLRLRCAKP